jgi:hypothetical protein
MSSPISQGGDEGIVGRISSEGIVEWLTYYGAGYIDRLISINLDQQGNPIVFGSTTNGFQGNNDIPFPTENPPNAFVQDQNNGNSILRSDACIIHFDNLQNLQWVTYWGGDADEFATCAYVAPNNRLYTGGTTATQNELEPGPTYPVPMVNFDPNSLLDHWQVSMNTSVPYVWSFGARFNLNDMYTVDINGESQSDHVVIFPNPISEFITIHGLNDAPFNYQLFDISGKLVQSIQRQNSNRLEIPDLSNGVYLISISQGKNNFQIKLVVQ